VKLFVDAWDPSYGSGMDQQPEDGPAESSSAKLDLEVEMAPEDWRPITAPSGTGAPDVVHLIDGVRRIDAHVSIDGDIQPYPGVAASYAAGSVRCDLRSRAATIDTVALRRGIFSAAPNLESLGSGASRYEAVLCEYPDLKKLIGVLQQSVLALESDVSHKISRGDELLVVDGPLRNRQDLPRILGYVKTHQKRYLPDRLYKMVGSLEPGQRSPIFMLGTQWNVYTWYLRLPGPPGSAWSGIVRIECSTSLATCAAVELANISAVALPRFASCAYKDPRAPQNLVPIAGLERRLRSMLGDARLLHRSLVRAAAMDPAAAGS
jgi:hypothetical protein